MKNYNAKLGRTLNPAPCGSAISKRLAALNSRRQEDILARFVQSLDGGRFEFAGARWDSAS